MRSRLAGSTGTRLALVALALLAGCYWSKYDKLARTHVQLLLAMADKLVAVTGDAGTPPASFAEYRYPLERARDFVRIVAPRFQGRRSVDALRALCDAYEEVLRAAERSTTGDAESTRSALEAARQRLHADASAVLQALDAEARR